MINEVFASALTSAAAIAAIAAAVAAFLSWKTSERHGEHLKRQADFAEQSHTMTSFGQIVLREYIHRPLVEPLKLDGKEITSLQEARQVAFTTLKGDWFGWAKEAQVRDGAPYPWQNRVASQTADALHHLAFVTLMGALPLGMVLSIASEVVTDDWLIAKPWVESYRAKLHELGIFLDGPPGEPVFRRQTQTLAYICAIWLLGNSQWRHERLSEFLHVELELDQDQKARPSEARDALQGMLDPLLRADVKLIQIPEMVIDSLKDLRIIGRQWKEAE